MADERMIAAMVEELQHAGAEILEMHKAYTAEALAAGILRGRAEVAEAQLASLGRETRESFERDRMGETGDVLIERSLREQNARLEAEVERLGRETRALREALSLSLRSHNA